MIRSLHILIYILLITGAFLEFSFGQATMHSITKVDGSLLRFNDGDSLPLIALKSSDYQLIVLVFHAEEDTIGMDPGLSIDGRWRAIHLSKLIKDIDFNGYYTTPFRNNILTMQPLLDSKHAKYSYYDQGDIQALCEGIKKSFPSPSIVVVHPETVNNILEQLTQQKTALVMNGNLSEKIIFIQRSKKYSSFWTEFKYSIR
jgi:hypothetical protein